MDKKRILKSFGAHLKFLRVEKGLSQEQLALHCDLDRTYISGAERGLRNVSLLNLHKLAKSLDVKLETLTNFNTEVDDE